MERFLRENPGVRWSLIFILLLGLVLEGVLIGNRLFVAGSAETAVPLPPFGSSPSIPTLPAVGDTLSCRVVNPGGLNLRRQPSVEGDNVIVLLAEGTGFTALERSGDVPWLRVQAAEQEGWLSSKVAGGQATVECEGELLSLPEANVEVAGLSSPEATLEATPAATPVLPPTLTPAPNLRLRVGNGPDLRVARRSADVALDGNLSEWGSTQGVPIGNVVHRPENWEGALDLSGTVRAVWDEQFLYLAVEATDQAIVQERREDQLFQGDSLEFFFDADLQGDFDVDQYNADDTQMVITGGDFQGVQPSAWVYGSPGGNFNDQIQIGARAAAGGYTLEIRLPWSGLGVTAQAGTVYGYAVALSDDDTQGDGGIQETQLSTTPQIAHAHPARWGNFVLD